MPHARRHGMPDLPDAEIEKYLPPGVPLKWPAEEVTGTDESFAAIHRTMIVGHARICAALEALAPSRRQLAAGSDQDIAGSRIAAISEEPLATRSEMNRGFSELKELISRRIDPLELTVRDLSRQRGARSPRRR